MTSMNSAFIRAYAKGETKGEPAPAEQPAIPPDVSPYTYFQTARRPEARYRVDAAPSAWGQPVLPPHTAERYAHESDEAIEAEIRLRNRRLQNELEPPLTFEREAPLRVDHGPAVPVSPSLPASNRTASIARAPEPAPIQPPASRSSLSAPPQADAGFVCLPGVPMPEANWSVPSQRPAPKLDPNMFAPSVIGPAMPPVVAPPAPNTATEARREYSPEPEIFVQSRPEEIAAPPRATIAHKEKTPKAEPIPAPAALWEVDRFYPSPAVEQLLHEYAYFGQAGEKLGKAAADGLKTLAITGIERGEGRTTLAICLARCAAKAGLKTILIDCDFSQPRLADELGLDINTGWQSVAQGRATLAETAIRSIEDGFTILPLAPGKQTLKGSDRGVAQTLAQAAEAFDVVILDLGPAGLTGEFEFGAEGKAPFDAALVVCDRRRRSLDDARRVGRKLQQLGVEAVGIAENFAGK